MTAPTSSPVAPADAARLKVHMTPAAYTQAVEAFGEEVIAAFITDHGRCLLRVAADLLDGLPNPAAAEGVAAVSGFKLDVLEFKFEKTQVVNYATMASTLRARAGTECPDVRRVNANPAPEFGSWEIT